MDAFSTPNTPLPDDPAVLRQMIHELLAQLGAAHRELGQVRQRLDQLLRRLYGPRTEKMDPQQPSLFDDPPVAAPAPPAAPPAAPRPGHGRRRLPAGLPRQRVVHELPFAERLCPHCQTERQPIGQEVSEQLDFRPASLFVVEHVRLTYACPCCQAAVATAAKPPQPIDKGLPGPGLLAYVAVSKYGDHLPLYRLERIFTRHGLDLCRSTLCDWIRACAELLTPLYAVLVSEVLKSAVLHTDDTVVPVLDGSRDCTRQGRLWVYLGDRQHPYNVFDYTASRARDGPATFLKDFQGYLQADAFGGYDGIYAGGDIVEVCCHAHARRKFYEARTTDAARSAAALGWYRELYAVEVEIKERNIEERYRVRQERSLPLLSAFRQWLDEQRVVVLPKSPLGQAVQYALNQWPALLRYTADGRLAIDNNVAEREMKRIAIGRKNWLFAGSDRGGTTAAVLYTLTSTCARQGVDAFVYLAEVIRRLPGCPAADVARLLPDRWAAARRTAAQDVASV
jgi:transposase